MPEESQGGQTAVPDEERRSNVKWGAYGLACLVVILASTVFCLLHPVRTKGVTLLGLCTLAPAVLIWFIKRTRVQNVVSKLAARRVPSGHVGGHVWALVFIFSPAIFAHLAWFFLYFAVKDVKLKDGPEYMRERLGAVLFFSGSPQVALSYVFVSIGCPFVGLYLAIPVIFFSFKIAMGGLTVTKGVLGFFGDYQAHSSPSSVLSCAILFASAFGALHYAVWSLRPHECLNMTGWQDAFYFSVTTMATVGFGDITPAGHLAKWLSVVEILAGFTLLVLAVNAAMAVWIQSHQPKEILQSAPAAARTSDQGGVSDASDVVQA